MYDSVVDNSTRRTLDIFTITDTRNRRRINYTKNAHGCIQRI